MMNPLKRMADWTNNRALRRYYRRFAIALLFYVASLTIAVATFKHHVTGPVTYVLAVLPALACVGMMTAYGIYLKEEKDELPRAMGVEALIWSTGATLSLTTIWGFLENFLKVPHLNLLFIYPIFWVFFAIAMPVIYARYK